MTKQKVVNILSVFNGFLGKLMPAICLAALGALAIMWADNRNFPKAYASIPVMNDVVIRVGLMEKDVGSIQKQLNRIEDYAQKQSVAVNLIQLDVIRLKFTHER